MKSSECYLKGFLCYTTICIILLLAFLQAPRTSRASLGKASVRAPNLSAQQTLSSHWHSIISSLSTLLTTMRANHVCVSLALIFFCTPFRIIPLRYCTKKFMIWWISMSEHEHRVGPLTLLSNYCNGQILGGLDLSLLCNSTVYYL